MAERRFKGKSSLPDVDLISIAQALLVAECLSFRGAAKMLGTRHSVVGRRIRTLEDRLGVSLFERHPGSVRLTVAGARFFAQCRAPLQQLDFAVKTAGAAGRAAIGHLNIGILSSMSAGFLREVVRTYHERQPDVLVQVLEGASVEQIALVRESQLDVAFVLGTPDLPNCEVTRLWAEHIYVAMPQGHALCGHDQVTWTSLRDEQIVLCHSELGRALHDQLIKQLAQFESALRVERLDVSHETLMHLVAMGWGVSLTTEAAIATQFPEVVFRPVADDGTTIPFSAAWLRNNDNPAFQRFRSLAREMSTKWERRPRDVAALTPPKHEKKKSNGEPSHSHVVRTKARRSDIKRQSGRGAQVDRSAQAPARDSKRGPAKRR